MIGRSLETRTVKLEASRRRPNELLLVWHRPGGNVKAAGRGAASVVEGAGAAPAGGVVLRTNGGSSNSFDQCLT